MSQRALVTAGRRATKVHSSAPQSQPSRCLFSSSPKTKFNSPRFFFRAQDAPLVSSLVPEPWLSQLSRTQTHNRTSSNRRLRFSTTATRLATTASLNPRVDDDGSPMTIEISSRAEKRLRELTNPVTSKPSLTSNSEPYDHLRVTVTSGGCHGFQYLMSLDPASKIDSEDDTVFEATAEDESTPPAGQAKVVMDLASLELLRGSTIDYTIELIGSQFKVVNNPRATSSCGCGTSFDVPE
ncbi:[4Fe-4S] proteins maturation [Ophidiomyces ophidiicola]|uniref:[4Fe-4S] proteins maturation n=1 Tax=Ophidiomyces ophidiicola TaxID=1387563 RepID=UPI0020C29CAC|nr:[4Fe-4S] proteins maturation [Ophidiomyces ophidiicola]KAI1951962.1 [4Fe-4S] proteins maturation [Ophidiomyces ophidiicola]KAI2047317.1 [4Fe-4S] proteins maturation [Ophidiomyces ophidiicola]